MVTTIVSKAEVILLIPISRQSQVADIRLRALICVVAIFIAGCQTKSSDATMEAVEHEEMITSLLRYREMIDSSFRSDSNSPFQQDSNVHFSGIKWFPPETAYRTESILYRNERPETVLVYGTKGDERRLLKYGYFLVSIEGKQLRVNAYKQVADQPFAHAPGNHLSVWFTDETTGKETYGVGRYLEVGLESDDRDHLYVLDFNRAYNPYCAYNPLYSCAIPRREDHLNIAIRAGELKYHP